VLEAVTPAEALERVDSAPSLRVDLLLIDLVMPKMSGPELAERLTARMGDVPILFMSGYTSEEVLNRGIFIRDARFISKPFSLDQLLACVRETIDARAQRAETSDAPAEWNPRPIRGRTVLLVDDDPAVRGTIRRALEAQGCAVIETRDAREAVQSLERTRPEVVVMDLVLPGIEGREAANLIHARMPDLPILYVSGYTSQESLRMEKLRERDGFLRKPFEVSELVAAIARLVLRVPRPPSGV
jgi:CheY-like chemotaxis protein